MNIDLSKLGNEIWDGVADDVKGALSPMDQAALKTAAEHVAAYYVQKLTGTVTDADHRAVKAILANVKNTMDVAAAEAIKRSLRRIVEKAAVVVAAL